MPSYQQLYTQKCTEFDELNEQFLAYQDESAVMIEEVQRNNEQLRTRNTQIEEEIETLKEKRKMQIHNLQKELELIKRQRNQFKTKFEQFHRKVIELQNINETLQSENRASNCMLNQYELRVEKTMEELALLQIQLEQNKSANQEQVARLKNQLKQTEQQLYVLHLKHQKHNDESEQRRSRLSSASFSSQQQISRIINQNQLDDKNDSQNNSLLNLDFKRNKQPSFGRTISLVKNLIGEIDEKAKKIRTKKRAYAV